MKKLLGVLQDLRFYFVCVSLTCLVLMTKYFNLKSDHSQTVKENLELKGAVDSLGSEMFIKSIELGSYELMWELLEEVNRPLADSINNQVE